jgi:alkaline phosphatase D
VLAQPAIPYNLDAWDGYAVARETVLGTAAAGQEPGRAGRRHPQRLGQRPADLSAATPVGVEFATSSVSSPGFESILPNEEPGLPGRRLTQLIGPLQYCDTARRGFLLLTVTPGACRADWSTSAPCSSRSYTAASDQALRVLPGAV